MKNFSKEAWNLRFTAIKFRRAIASWSAGRLSPTSWLARLFYGCMSAKHKENDSEASPTRFEKTNLW